MDTSWLWFATRLMAKPNVNLALFPMFLPGVSAIVW